MGGLKGEAWIITGVTRGLGLALARWAAREGYVVYGCGSQAETVAVVAEELGSPHRVECVDVSDAAAVAVWVSRIAELSAPFPNRVINNAAIINRSAPLWEIDFAEFERLMAINVCGSFHLIKAVMPYLLASGGGVIVNLSSGWGRSVSPDVAPYCASKWAIEGLTQALAEELPERIAAYALNPGVIDTAMLRSCFGEGAKSSIKPAAWAEAAGPLIAGLSATQGKVSISV